jgi:hypothetical protein
MQSLSRLKGSMKRRALFCFLSEYKRTGCAFRTFYAMELRSINALAFRNNLAQASEPRCVCVRPSLAVKEAYVTACMSASRLPTSQFHLRSREFADGFGVSVYQANRIRGLDKMFRRYAAVCRESALSRLTLPHRPPRSGCWNIGCQHWRGGNGCRRQLTSSLRLWRLRAMPE